MTLNGTIYTSFSSCYQFQWAVDLHGIFAGSFRGSLFIDLGAQEILGKGGGETLALLW